MTEPIENIDYEIADFGEHGELRSVLLTGLLAGVKNILQKGYKINYDSCTISGMMYIIPFQKSGGTFKEYNQIEIMKEEIESLDAKCAYLEASHKEEIDQLKIENRTLKAQLTRLKKKLD